MTSRGAPLHLANVGYAVPPPGYAPYPYPVPYPMFPQTPPRTEAGLTTLRWALGLGATTQAIAIPGFVWLAILVATFPSGGGAIPTTFEFVAAALAFGCVAGAVGFVAAIIFLLGAYNCYEGRDEYGPEHARDIEHAVIFFIIAFVMGIVASVGGIGMSSSPFGFGYPFNPFGGLFGAVRGLFVGLLLRSVAKTFLKKEELDLGWAGTALLTAAPAIGGGASLLLLPSSFIGSPAPPPGLALAFAIAAGLAAAELVAYVLFLVLYTRAIRRLKSGEIPPAPRPPVLYVPPYFPGPPYYPYPVVPAYPEPPPASPPPGQPPP